MVDEFSFDLTSQSKPDKMTGERERELHLPLNDVFFQLHHDCLAVIAVKGRLII